MNFVHLSFSKNNFFSKKTGGPSLANVWTLLVQESCAQPMWLADFSVLTLGPFFPWPYAHYSLHLCMNQQVSRQSTEKWAEECQGGGNIRGDRLPWVQSHFLFFSLRMDLWHISDLHTGTTEFCQLREDQEGRRGRKERRGSWGGDACVRRFPDRGGLGCLLQHWGERASLSTADSHVGWYSFWQWFGR